MLPANAHAQTRIRRLLGLLLSMARLSPLACRRQGMQAHAVLANGGHDWQLLSAASRNGVNFANFC